MNKVKKSVRFDEFNYELISSISNIAFDGNFSKGLNFLLRLLRNHSNFSDLLRFFNYKARYDRGERSKEVLNGKKGFETALLKIMTELTKNPEDSTTMSDKTLLS